MTREDGGFDIRHMFHVDESSGMSCIGFEPGLGWAGLGCIGSGLSRVKIRKLKERDLSVFQLILKITKLGLVKKTLPYER